MAFTLPFAEKGGKVYMKCVIDPDTKELNWMHQLVDRSWSATLPSCNYVCPKNPLDDPEHYNRTWTKGSLTAGMVAKYKCLGEHDFEKLGFYPKPKSISMAQITQNTLVSKIHLVSCDRQY